MAQFIPHLHRAPWLAGDPRGVPSGPIELARDQPQARGLLGFWPLDPLNQARSLTERYHGTPTTVPTFGPSPTGSMIKTNPGYVSLGTGVAPTSGVTFLAWIVANALGGTYNSVIDRSNGSTDFIELMVTAAGKLAAFVRGSTAQQIDPAPTVLSLNRLYCIALTADAGGTKVFVNGTQDASTAAPGTMSSAGAVNTYIGNSPATTGRTFNGLIGGVRIYDRALAAAEIAGIYAEPWADVRPAADVPLRRAVATGGVARALTPNAAGAASSQAGTVARSRALSGAGTAAGTSAASMTATRALTAAATAASSQAAALARSRALSGAATAGTSQAGSVGRMLVLTPNAATAASSQSATEAATRAMLAAATAATAQSGSVARSRALAGATTALTTQAGSIASFIQGQLAGQAFAAGTASAALHATRALQGAATAAGTAAGSIGRGRSLAGASGAATAAQAASLHRSRQLAPLAAAASSDQAGALVALHALRIAGTAAGSAQATLGRSRPLIGAATAASSQTGRLTAGDLPAPAVVHNIVRFDRDLRIVRFERDLRTVRFTTRADMAKPKSFKRKHPLANPWYGIGLGEPLTGTPAVVAACSVVNATPVDVRSVQIADTDATLIEFQASGGDDGTLWTLTASATSALDQSLLVVDVLLPVERHFGG